MKVTVKDRGKPVKPTASNVPITFTEIEAGYLRSIMGGMPYNPFAFDVSKELDCYSFPAYEVWRQNMEDKCE